MNLFFEQEILFGSQLMENLFYILLLVILLAAIVSLVLVIINYKKRANSEILTKKELEEKNEELSQIKNNHTELEKNYADVCEHFDELTKVKDKLYTLAYTDTLTNLPNKYNVIEQIDSTFATLRKDEKFVLIHLDVDDFKRITDIIGHSYGDELLLDISHRIREAIDENDFLARLTSDEFVIFSQNIEELGEFDEKVKKIQKVFSYPFIVSSKEVAVTVSMGLAVGPDNAKSTQQIMTNANLAMYEAKKKGKNTYCYYNDEIGEQVSREVLVQSEITQGVANDEFELYLQPVYGINNNKIISYEALVRWIHEDEERMPHQFMDVAYRTGQMSDIDEIMIEKSCEFIKEMSLKCEDSFFVSVNLSPKYLFSNNFITNLHDILSKTGVKGDRIIFEIKEKLVSENYNKVYDIVRKLDSIGVRICVDNYGLGVTSLKAICQLPIYMIKIDKSVLEESIFDVDYKNLCVSILRACDLSGVKCVVEGIEQEEQRVYVSELGCYGMQGFALGIPVNSKKI